MSETKTGRRRRSSSIIYQEPPESIEHTSDQAALPNLNANWVNAKGEELHFFLVNNRDFGICGTRKLERDNQWLDEDASYIMCYKETQADSNLTPRRMDYTFRINHRS